MIIDIRSESSLYVTIGKEVYYIDNSTNENIMSHHTKQYKTCDRCCYDILDNYGDIMEHYCIDNELY